MFALDPPATKPEILRALIAVDRESEAFWRGFPDERFFAPIGEAWSPAENVRHLTKSIRPVARAMKQPRFVLTLLFGQAKRPSRRYEEIVELYRSTLARGADAGRFAPRREEPPADLASRRAQIMDYRATASAHLAVAIAAWSEEALDRHRLPHPLLGKLTVREMLFFTLYHNQHHPANVARRLGGET